MQSSDFAALPKQENSQSLPPDALASRRVKIYIFLSVFLAISYYFLSGIPWETTSFFHTVMEIIASLLAIIVGSIALVRYYAKKSLTYLFIAMGFLGSGLLDTYHTLVSAAPIAPLFPSGIQELFIWSWTAARSFLASFLFFSWLFWWKAGSKNVETVEKFVYIISPIFMIAVFVIVLSITLPSPYFSFFGVTRPADAVAGVFFLLALLGYLSKGDWKKDDVENWLIISIILSIAVQVCMATSLQIHDMMFNLAHFFKIASYLAMLIGLLLSMYHLFKDSERLNINLAHAQQALKQYSTDLEDTVAERTKDLGLKNKELESAVPGITNDTKSLGHARKTGLFGGVNGWNCP